MTTALSGIITDDPAAGLPIGAKLEFRPLTPVYSGSEKAVALRDWESFEGTVAFDSFSHTNFSFH
jgi:hypothetical protein